MGYAMLRDRAIPRGVRETVEAPYAAPGDGPDGAVAAADDADADAGEELAEEICIVAAQVHAGTRWLLGLLAEFDAEGGWKPGGHLGCENWLSLHTGYALRTAREYVRVARALEGLPETGASMGRGALSFDQVRALTRVATPQSESDLLALAENCTTGVLERECRAWKSHSRKDEAEQERARHASRRLAIYPNGDGMHRVDGLVTPETAATFGKALLRAGFQLYREDRKAGCLLEISPEEASRRRADALGLVAEWALGAGPGPGEHAPISGSRAAHFQVMLYVEPATLAATGEPGRSEFEDGTRLAAETARRLACDCALVRVERAPDGSVLNVGRSTRSIPSALRRALEVRDRGCRFPGCGLRVTDGHHVLHWADGGETSLRNTLLVCRRHHRLVHEEGWRVEWWGRERHVVFIDPRGQAHGSLRPRPPLQLDPLRELVLDNLARGAAPDATTAGARWKRERDIPDQVLFRALEATAPG
jgi:hypothetical protein